VDVLVVRLVMWMLAQDWVPFAQYCKERSTTMEQAEKIAMIKELRVSLHTKVQEVIALIDLLERGPGARELSLTRTNLQQAKHWAGEALGELGEYTYHILTK
jgi:hypothetical protein